MFRILALALLLAFAGLAAWWCFFRDDTLGARAENSPRIVVGRVVGPSGPIIDATVRVKGRAESALTGADGSFRLRYPAGVAGLRVAASKVGYFIASAGVSETDAKPLLITLTPLPSEDCRDYRWVDPRPGEGEHRCANCHEEIYRQWSAGGHARSATGRKFLDLYAGTDVHGRQRGWSLLKEHPAGAGVCVSCHAPTVAVDEPAHDDLRLVKGVHSQGVHCDFCHKIQDALDDAVGLAHGRDGLKLLRPKEGQLFLGPLDDVDRGEDAFAPVYRQSRYCASCHEGVVFGVHVYSTYSEWLASPARAAGQQCQSCHAKPDGKLANIAPGSGGIERDPSTLASHNLLPGGRAKMLRDCLEVAVEVSRERNPAGELVSVNVEILAKNVGHRVPTGFIDRHLLLLAEAFDAEGKPLFRTGGPTIPAVADERLAGRAGSLFAKLLLDVNGQRLVPFWRPAAEPRDTRLVPDQPSRGRYTFPGDARRVRVRLVYRRFWAAVAREKQWPDDEITVFDRSYDAPVAPVVAGGPQGG